MGAPEELSVGMPRRERSPGRARDGTGWVGAGVQKRKARLVSFLVGMVTSPVAPKSRQPPIAGVGEREWAVHEGGVGAGRSSSASLSLYHVTSEFGRPRNRSEFRIRGRNRNLNPSAPRRSGHMCSCHCLDPKRSWVSDFGVLESG